MKPDTDLGPSPALTVHMKTIGHLDKDVHQLGVNFQVLNVRTELYTFESTDITEDYPIQYYCYMSCLATALKCGFLAASEPHSISVEQFH